MSFSGPPNDPGLNAPAGMSLQATTPGAGTPLINGTATILSWTAPNDGKMHSAMIAGSVTTTVASTGGAISITTSGGVNLIAQGGTNGVGESPFGGQSTVCALKAGETVSVTQSSAMTAGTAACNCQIWGA